MRLYMFGLGLLLSCSSTKTSPENATNKQSATLVTIEGIGSYRLGDAPKPGATKDGDGASYQDGDLSIYYAAGKLCSVMTSADKYKTKEGLGVGNTFGEFEKAFGVTYVEAATGDIFFPEKYRSYRIGVDNMPNEGDKKPELASKVNSFGVDNCPREAE